MNTLYPDATAEELEAVKLGAAEEDAVAVFDTDLKVVGGAAMGAASLVAAVTVAVAVVSVRWW